jgi:hypothetical protein
LQSVNFACPECKHLAAVPVPDEIKPFECPDQLQHPDDTISYLVFLGCGDKNCKLQIPVFAPMEPGTKSAQADARMRAWLYDDLTCQAGHPLQHPYVLRGVIPV